MPISFDDFITKWTGIGIDVDNYPSDNKFQCMDLMHKYVEEVLGLTDSSLLADSGASQAYKNFSSHPIWGKYFQKIDNTLWNAPQKGDIVFWDGTYGHVAVFVNGNVLNFNSFDQNFPTGSLPHIQNHNYLSPKVLGWLRFIPQIPVVNKYELAYKQIKSIIDSTGV